MEKGEIRSLGKTPVEQLHQAFVDAFSDYEVPLSMPFDKFVEMMKNRDLNREYSLGYFAGNRLAGFVICGFRKIGDKTMCYDGGTGVIKEFRRKGIGEKLLGLTLEMIRERKVNQFILEVLENNEPAINLYEKYGFRKSRRLECFKIQKSEVLVENISHFKINFLTKTFNILATSDFELYKPSWQNSSVSINNVIENYAFLSIEKGNKVVCYGLIHKTRGDIPQIGILDEWKNRDFEQMLIGRLAQLTASERITVLNVEEGNYLGEKLRNLGFKNFVNQYEMILEIA